MIGIHGKSTVYTLKQTCWELMCFMYGLQGTTLTWVQIDILCIICYGCLFSKLDKEGWDKWELFVKILDNDGDEDDELNCPQIISHSSYYDFEKLLLILQACKNKFTIFSTNIQSINAKIHELRLFIESLKSLNFMFSAICVQESWLSEGDDTFLIQLEGYECILLFKANHAAPKGV